MNLKVKKVLPKEFADVCKSYEIQCLGRPESEHMSDTIFENELLKVERENAKNKLAGSTDGSVSLASTSQKKGDGLRVTKSKKKSEIKCFACGEIGHMKFQCKKRKSKRGSKDTEETARKDVTLCSIFNSKNLVGLVNLDAKNKFIADDGASFHVVNDSSLVENLKSTREEVLATMNGEITATSKGR